MLMTKRKPATVGEILVEEFMKPIGLTQGALAKAMGVQRKLVNELCNDRRKGRTDGAHLSPVCSAMSRNSGSMCSGEASCGKRCIHRANGN